LSGQQSSFIQNTCSCAESTYIWLSALYSDVTHVNYLRHFTLQVMYTVKLAWMAGNKASNKLEFHLVTVKCSPGYNQVSAF